MPRRGLPDHPETVSVRAQRIDDWAFAFQTRPFVVELGSRRHTISPLEAQLLLGELARLPEGRHQAAAQTAESVRRSLSRGQAIAFDEAEQRVVLRAIEGVRARRRLSTGLARLRNLLASQPAGRVV